MKYLFTFLITASLVALLVVFGTTNNNNSEYLRIHIRANSNLNIDQAVKYEVKDAVVDYLIPLVATAGNKTQSVEIINKNLSNIEEVADNILQKNGFSYKSSAKINNEEFPTRNYSDLTLESGFYDALILELGSGTGDNWWCVVYPPLCFVNGSTNVTAFKSRIIEIINNFGIKI